MSNKGYKFTAEADPQKAARLDLFGEVGGGFWSEGFDASTFKAAMGVVGETQPLDIYINSNGGSVFAAIAIYNLIARHKGAVTIRVAGMAASAATIITSAPNAKVIMPLGSMMLVHPVRVSADLMTPEELKKAAENLEKVRASVIEIYKKKTCKGEDELLDLMSTESYLTPTEAVALGFADEVDEFTEVENTALGDIVMVNGLKVSAQLFAHAPKGFINYADKPKASAEQTPTKEVKIMTLEMLKAEHPEIVEAIRNEAVKEGIAQERARIQAIEEIAVEGHDEMVQAAKFGEQTMTAEQLAVAMLKADKVRKATALANRIEDAKALNGVVPTGNTGIDPKGEAKAREAAERAEFIKAATRGYNK
ncbi:MAG: head maturation protease, ClpP-related [Candidatus Spyradenecus sp.]